MCACFSDSVCPLAVGARRSTPARLTSFATKVSVNVVLPSDNSQTHYYDTRADLSSRPETDILHSLLTLQHPPLQPPLGHCQQSLSSHWNYTLQT
jgi:hypothetical protein